jgi:hypothetical protein
MGMLVAMSATGKFRQVATVAAVDGHVPDKEFFMRKNPELIRVADLQFVEEFSAPLLPHFLSV